MTDPMQEPTGEPIEQTSEEPNEYEGVLATLINTDPAPPRSPGRQKKELSPELRKLQDAKNDRERRRRERVRQEEERARVEKVQRQIAAGRKGGKIAAANRRLKAERQERQAANAKIKPVAAQPSDELAAAVQIVQLLEAMDPEVRQFVLVLAMRKFGPR